MEGCVQIISNPNKPNIRYAVVNIDHNDIFGTFSHIINDIRENNIKASKVLVFCCRKEHVKELFELFSEHLGALAYHRPMGEEPCDDRTRIFAMYHKKTHNLVKSTVEKEFCKHDGTVRVVFCTIAFGMGINVKGANLVIHLGPSSDLDDYLQESGRIGRTDDKMSHAVLLRFKGCTRSKNITNEMKDYIRNESECRQPLLLKPFSFIPEQNVDTMKHSCCDICAEFCKCNCDCNMANCQCINPCHKQLHQSSFEIAIQKLHAEKNSKIRQTTKVVNDVTEEQRVLIHDRLMAYRSELAHNCSHEKLLTGLDYATGFSSVLVKNILDNAKYINSLQAVKYSFPFYADEHAIKTWEVISEVLELVPDEKGNVQAAASDCDINSPAHIFDNEIPSSDTDDSDNDIIKKTFACKLQAVLTVIPTQNSLCNGSEMDFSPFKKLYEVFLLKRYWLIDIYTKF